MAASTKALLWFLPVFALLAVAVARDHALTDLERLLVRSWLTALVALGIVKVSIAGRGIMGIKARWERALVRWLFLLAVGLSALPSFIALEYVACMLLLGAWASRACVAVAVAVYLYFGWVAVFGT